MDPRDPGRTNQVTERWLWEGGISMPDRIRRTPWSGPHPSAAISGTGGASVERSLQWSDQALGVQPEGSRRPFEGAG